MDNNISQNADSMSIHNLVWIYTVWGYIQCIIYTVCGLGLKRKLFYIINHFNIKGTMKLVETYLYKKLMLTSYQNTWDICKRITYNHSPIEHTHLISPFKGYVLIPNHGLN